jgi:hypothetical protein
MVTPTFFVAIILIIILFIIYLIFIAEIPLHLLYVNEDLSNQDLKYHNIINLNEMIEMSSDGIKNNIEKFEVLNNNHDTIIMREIDEKLKIINNIETNNKQVIDENHSKTHKLKEINKNLDILIVSKEEKEKQLNETNKNMTSIIDFNSQKIEKLISLNEQMTDIITISCKKIDEFTKKQCDKSFYNNISEEIKSYLNTGNTSGGNITNGTDKHVFMDESSIFVKVDPKSNYYSPLYKVETFH